MAPRKINRDEWARQVARLIAEEAAGNKSRFAAKVSKTYKTVGRWLNSEVDVEEESVRDVARAFGVSPADLLVRVGYYEHADFQPTPPLPELDTADDTVRKILTSDLKPAIKRRMLDRLRAQRTAQREREAEEVAWWIEQARGA